MLGALSLQLTEAIALVEMQRSTLSELILRLASDAQQLNGVAAALAEAATAQAEVLSALQRSDGTAEQNGHAARSSSLDDSSGGASSSRAEEDEHARSAALAAAVAAQRRVHVPRRAAAVVEPDMSDDEGVEYVKNLRVTGSATLGEALQATGEFVGTPSAQWFRLTTSGAVEIDGASSLSYTPNADDVGKRLRVDVVGPYGGNPVIATSAQVSVGSTLQAQLTKMGKTSKSAFALRVSPTGEAAQLELSKGVLKIKPKSGKAMKHPLPAGVTVTLDAYEETAFSLTLGRTRDAPQQSLSYTAESAGFRDLLALYLRSVTKEVAPTRSARDDGDGGGEFLDDQKKVPTSFNDFGTPDSDDEAEGEEEAFRPAIEVKILPAGQEIAAPSLHQLKSSFNLGAPPGRPRSVADGRRSSDTVDSPPAKHAGAPVAAALPSAPTSVPESPTLPPSPQHRPLRNGAAAPPAAPTRSAQRKEAAAYQLTVQETITALFDGAKVRQFKAIGELHAAQLEGAVDIKELSAFKFALERTDKTSNLQLNGKVLRRQSESTFDFAVALEPPSNNEPVPLLRYSSIPNWAPIPLKVVPQWSLNSAQGAARLVVLILTHPNLKQGLRDIALRITVPDAKALISADPNAIWDEETHELAWELAHLMPEKAPRRYTATFRGSPGAPPGTPQPLRVQFTCEGTTLTNLTPRPTDRGREGQLSASVVRRFVAGKYEIAVPPPNGSAAS